MLLAGGTREFDRQIAAPSNPNSGRASIHQLNGRAWTRFFPPFLRFSGGGRWEMGGGCEYNAPEHTHPRSVP